MSREFKMNKRKFIHGQVEAHHKSLQWYMPPKVFAYYNIFGLRGSIYIYPSASDAYIYQLLYKLAARNGDQQIVSVHYFKLTKQWVDPIHGCFVYIYKRVWFGRQLRGDAKDAWTSWLFHRSTCKHAAAFCIKPGSARIPREGCVRR